MRPSHRKMGSYIQVKCLLKFKKLKIEPAHIDLGICISSFGMDNVKPIHYKVWSSYFNPCKRKV